MRAGVAAKDITPGIGGIIPGQWLTRYAESVRDPLRVTALVLEEGGALAAIVSCDVCAVPPACVAAARAELSDRLGLPAERLFIHATHTHTGPPVLEALGTPSVPEWIERLTRAIVEATCEAAERREAAEIAWATAEAPGLAFPRRYWMDDGTVRMHPSREDPTLLRPDGVPDEALTVLGIHHPGARLPHAVVASFACHPIVVGNALFYSGDYPGAVCRALRGLIGGEAEALYVNGFCADVGPDDVDSPISGYGEEAMERIGVALASRAMLALLEAPRAAAAPLAGFVDEVELAIRKPSPETLAEARAALPGDLGPIPQDTRLIVMRELLLLQEEIERSPVVQAEVIHLRIGDGGLVGWPGEVFSAYGRRLRRISPLPHLMPGCLVNGLQGYIPTREAFLGGGYETWLCRTSKLEEAAGDRLLAATRDLLLGACMA